MIGIGVANGAPDRRQRRDLRHRLRRLSLPLDRRRLHNGAQWHELKQSDGARPGSSWSAPPSRRSSPGYEPRGTRRGRFAAPVPRAPLSRTEPVDLVIVDRDSSGLDAPAVCRKLRDDPRLGDAWLLAITVAAKGRMADSVLDAGADDYLHRPFTRAELIARARAGLRAAEQRANDRLLRTLMENVPGAIYRSAWHADFVLEAISDEIERISGYSPPSFLSSIKRTILSIVHPDDADVVLETVAALDRAQRAVRARVPDRPRRRRGALGPGPRPARAGPGRAAVAGRGAVRHHGAPRRRGRAAGPQGRGRAHGRAARLAPAHPRGRRRRPAQDRARPARRRAAAARQPRARRPGRAPPARQGPDATSARSWRGSATSSRRPRPSCASWPAASIPPSSPSAGSSPRSARSPPARRSRSRSSTRPASASRPRSRRPPTSPSPRR